MRALDLRDSLGRVSPSGRDSLRWPGACAPPRASILPVRLSLIKPDWTDRKPDLLFSHALRGLAGLRTATRPSFHDMKSQLCALEFLLNHRYEQAWRLSAQYSFLLLLIRFGAHERASPRYHQALEVRTVTAGNVMTVVDRHSSSGCSDT